MFSTVLFDCFCQILELSLSILQISKCFSLGRILIYPAWKSHKIKTLSFTVACED